MNHSVSLPKEIWDRIYSEASLSEKSEPILAGYLHDTILKYNDLNSALSAHLANKLASSSAPASMLNPALNASFSDPKILNKIAHDIQATVDRDSACNLFSTPFLHFKGFLSLQAYRASHSLWVEGKKSMALLLQHRVSVAFAVDIHPAAVIGSGVMIDHATGLVIGETAEVGDRCLLYQGVTLGGTGKHHGKRHPTLASNVVIGAGAKVLGSIDVGANTRVGAGSVVVRDVEANCTVVGLSLIHI